MWWTVFDLNFSNYQTQHWLSSSSTLDVSKGHIYIQTENKRSFLVYSLQPFWTNALNSWDKHKSGQKTGREDFTLDPDDLLCAQTRGVLLTVPLIFSSYHSPFHLTDILLQAFSCRNNTENTKQSSRIQPVDSEVSRTWRPNAGWPLMNLTLHLGNN